MIVRIREFYDEAAALGAAAALTSSERWLSGGERRENG
jgi:hypothetical protein